MKKININVILILLVVLLMVSPFFFNKTGEYGGSDGKPRRKSPKSIQAMNHGLNLFMNQKVAKLKAYYLRFKVVSEQELSRMSLV